MAILNKVQLIGNIGTSPESRVMPDGTAVGNFRVATTQAWKDKASGERVEATEWHTVVCYRRLAEFVRDFMCKGRQVHIDGSLHAQMDRQGRC